MSIFCIILAVFLITAIFGMADMFIRSQIIQAKIDNGDFHITVQGITDEEARLIKKRPDVKAAARYGVLNFNDDKGYTISDKKSIIVGADEEFVTQLQMGVINEGNFPQNDNEAMITKNAGENLGLQIGDTVTIKRPGEPELSYQISGFCNNTSKIMSEDAYGVFLTTSAFREIGDISDSTVLADHNMVLFVQFTKTYNIQNTINRLKEDCNLSAEQISENTKLLGLLGQSSNSFMMQVYISAFVLFVLVLTAGIMMITSSLNSNVAQRTEFFGLMRCVGATPKQIMKFVRKEALNWCKVAIPIGIITGVLIIWILCALLRVLSPEFFSAMPIFGISIPSIAAGIAIGILTVLLASCSPAKKAAKVSPLAAVSGNAINLQPVRTAANTKFFKVDTALGIHHAKSSRKNFFLTITSFSLSVILFLSFSVAVTFMNHVLTPLRPWTADISVISPDNTCSIDSGLLEKLQENPAVNRAYGRMFAYDVPSENSGKSYNANLISYEENQFQWAADSLVAGSIETVMQQENQVLFVQTGNVNVQVGDKITLSINNTKKTVTVAGILSDSPLARVKGTETFFCSEATFSALTGETGYTIIDIQFENNASSEDVNAIKNIFTNGGVIFSDSLSQVQQQRNLYYTFAVLVYGFLSIIVAITIFHIMNTINLGVAAKMKEYGSMRAIGMSNRQLIKMIIAEAGTYAISGVIWGCIIGLPMHWVIYVSLITNIWGTAWSVPFIPLILIIAIVLLTSLLAVKGPAKRLQRMSIVENISAQ